MKKAINISVRVDLVPHFCPVVVIDMVARALLGGLLGHPGEAEDVDQVYQKLGVDEVCGQKSEEDNGG